MPGFKTLAQLHGGSDLHRFSQADYLQSFSTKEAEAFVDENFDESTVIDTFYRPRNMVGGFAQGGVCRALSVAYILSHRLKKYPNPKFGQKTYFQAFINNAGQHPDNAKLKAFLAICRAQLKFIAQNGQADENTGKNAAVANVKAVCPGELIYASDCWIINGAYSGHGVNPFVTSGYWLISAGVHMTALAVDNDGLTSHYFDPNKGDAKFAQGAAGFVAAWFAKQKWSQTRFIQFIDA